MDRADRTNERPGGAVAGEALRERRTRLGFSQDDLARAAGIDVTTVCNIEAGRNRPRPSTLRLLADALRIHGSERDRLIAAGTPPLSPSAGDLRSPPHSCRRNFGSSPAAVGKSPP